MRHEQRQAGGDDSVNLQAHHITITQNQCGLTYTEVKDLCMTLFRDNFYQLSVMAADTARSRAEEITQKFLEEWQKTNPEGLNRAEDPDFQFAFLKAQIEYARSGDENLADILVDLLVEMSKENKRSLVQIVLNESLNTVPKLTESQINALTLSFLITRTRCKRESLKSFIEYFNECIDPFIDGISEKLSSYQHLQFTGCISLDRFNTNIADILLGNYPAIFSKGFSKEIVDEFLAIDERLTFFFIPCFHDSSLYQIRTLGNQETQEIGQSMNLDSPLIQRLVDLQNNHKMSPEELDVCLERLEGFPIERYRQLKTLWRGSALNRMTLTSVGTCIAHSNIRRRGLDCPDLSIWIHE